MITIELKTYLPCRDGELIMSRYLELEELPGVGTQLCVDAATWRVIEVYLEDHNDGRHWRVEADPPEDLACGGDMDHCAAAWAQEGWTINNQLET